VSPGNAEAYRNYAIGAENFHGRVRASSDYVAVDLMQGDRLANGEQMTVSLGTEEHEAEQHLSGLYLHRLFG
jgi:hypothetical protein